MGVRDAMDQSFQAQAVQVIRVVSETPSSPRLCPPGRGYRHFVRRNVMLRQAKVFVQWARGGAFATTGNESIARLTHRQIAVTDHLRDDDARLGCARIRGQ
jgi:hypothetical protein